MADTDSVKRWEIRGSFPAQLIVSPSDGGCIVSRMGGDSTEEDARLIAAAPDLLAFAREYLSHLHFVDDPLVIQAKAVIAKATGGAS